MNVNMRKLVLLPIVLLFLGSSLQAQKPKPITQTPVTTPQQPTQKASVTEPNARQIVGEHFARKYAVATRWNDSEVAKDALYDLIIEYPGNDSLIFALAYYYYEHQNPTSSVLVCQDLLARNPKSIGALELAAIGYESLNINDRALQSYESLYLLSSDPNVLYKMCFLQFDLKKYPECMTNIDILLKAPEANSTKVTYNDKDEKPKEYAMKVALLNLKGMVYKEQTDKVNAKKCFDEALAAAPDFVLAKKNLEGLK